ncbi:glutamate 5-kinase [Sphingorhabdus sp. Alg239-R122]|uniref:glutamate 5-kinase n=1 Tax=Sphingorhabdus sp. Alg239-R122 TaxID=2305989 RepID=UPI0031F6EEEC
MSNVFAPSHCPRLVVKIGSALLVDTDGNARREWMRTVAGDMAERILAGQQVMIVSSGAIALGARKLSLKNGGRENLCDAQSAAAVGQIALSALWAELLAEKGLVAAQMLVTLDALEDRRRYLNFTATLDSLLAKGAIPVINENDSLATDEIRFGDNDRLAARIGQAAGADGLILLSDVDGLYDKDPARHDTARIIREVREMDETILAMADDTSSIGTGTSGVGTGGMSSKLLAAKISDMAGMNMAIISGLHEHPLRRAQEGHGTIFHAQRGENRHKGWIGGLQKIRGKLHIDEGAAAAIVEGSSLLPAGIVKIEGPFSRGDAVDIIDVNGSAIARGLAEYDALDSARIIGRHSSEIEAILGYSPRSAVVHRDRMVIL